MEDSLETPKGKFIGMVQFLIHETHSAYAAGMRGGYTNFAAEAIDVSWASMHASNELASENFIAIGFSQVIDVRFLDRLPTEYESELISQLSTENDTVLGDLHLYPADA